MKAATCRYSSVTSPSVEFTYANLPLTMEFNDVRLQYEQNAAEIDLAITNVLSGGRYILGPVGLAFEEEFARYCKAARGVGVASGTDALRIGLAALGVG